MPTTKRSSQWSPRSRALHTAARSRRLAVAALTVLIAAGPAFAAGEPKVIDLIGTDGAVVGRATLMDVSGGLHIVAELDNVPSGTHGLHLHATGVCDAGDGFKSAGGHISGDSEHGFLVDGGPHPGDMPNIHVPASGELVIEVLNPAVTLAAGEDPAALLDKDGSAIMIHAGADDYTSQPSGAAGDRIACGVIRAR